MLGMQFVGCLTCMFGCCGTCVIVMLLLFVIGCWTFGCLLMIGVLFLGVIGCLLVFRFWWCFYLGLL